MADVEYEIKFKAKLPSKEKADAVCALINTTGLHAIVTTAGGELVEPAKATKAK